jgi:general secretion pathway protein J
LRRARGFTLIELLIAMAIIAIIGVIALTGIRTVIDQQEIATARMERWREIQFAMQMIVRDLSQVHPRLTRDERGFGSVPSFLADPTHPFALEFSRGGWTNPAAFTRGSVLRVAYDIEDDTLVRFYWPIADRTLATAPVRNELLTGIVEMQVTYYDDDNVQSAEWPPIDAQGSVSPLGLPRAVMFWFDLEDLGQVWRIVEVKP